MSEQFWIEDFSLLFQQDKMLIFFPTKNMSCYEIMNSVTRLSIYLSMALYLYNRSSKMFFIAVIINIIMIVIYKSNRHYLEKLENEHFSLTHEYNNVRNCTEPTVNNPFMNVMMNDYSKNPNRKKACKSYDIPKIKEKIETTFNHNLYSDVTDIYNRNHSQRQFYTTASTTIPNDQNSFANWLYHSPPTCKEGNGNQCIANQYSGLDTGSRLERGNVLS